MNILVIGGTGFIGQRLVRSLHSHGHSIYVLSRSQSLAKAKNIFKDLTDINFIQGDIENTDVLGNITGVAQQIDKIECVIHLAAVYKLNVSLRDAYVMNVLGTQNVINLLRKMKNVKHFHYFSTYAVNQLIKGQTSEEYLAPEGASFFDNYAKTKNNAEHLVRVRTPSHIKVVIHRPGIIVGDSRDGSLDKEDGPYYFFKFIKGLKHLGSFTKKLSYLPLPVQKQSLMPVLPVNTLIDWSTQIILNPKSQRLSCYHLIPSQPILTKEYLEYSMELLGLPLKILSIPQTQIFPPVFQVINLPKELVFYMKQEAQLERSNLAKDYPDLVEPSFKDYLPTIIEGYLRKQDERNIKA